MAETQTKRYPVRGALYGLLIGLGAAYLLYFQFAVFGFDSLGGVITRFVAIIVGGIVVGILWSYVAPARKPKEHAPVAIDTPPAAVMLDDTPPAAVMVDDDPPAAVEVDGSDDDETAPNA